MGKRESRREIEEEKKTGRLLREERKGNGLRRDRAEWQGMIKTKERKIDRAKN